VFFGMAGVTVFGLFLTPVFYVALRWVSLRGSLRPAAAGPTPAGGPLPVPDPARGPEA
jgi:hypothetical protein